MLRNSRLPDEASAPPVDDWPCCDCPQPASTTTRASAEAHLIPPLKVRFMIFVFASANIKLRHPDPGRTEHPDIVTDPMQFVRVRSKLFPRLNHTGPGKGRFLWAHLLGHSSGITKTPKSGSLAQSKSDSRLAQIVGRHQHPNPVPSRQPYKMLSHFSGNMGEHLMFIVKHHSKHGARENRYHGSLNFNRSFRAHRTYGIPHEPFLKKPPRFTKTRGAGAWDCPKP